MNPALIIGWTWAGYCMAGTFAFVWMASVCPVDYS